MKNPSFIPVPIRIGTLLAACMLVSPFAKAQTAVYFDPNDSGTTTAGGSGDFSTSDFWNPNTSTDGPFISGTTPVISGGSTTVTLGEDAVFNGPGSTVEVSAPVNPYSLEIGVTSGTETFGTTGNEAQISFPMGNGVRNTDPTKPTIPYNPITINSAAAPGTENVVFNSNVNFDIAQPYYTSLTLNNYSSGNLAFNGGITFSNYTTDGDSVGEPNLEISENTAGGSVTINSAVTAVNEPGSTPIANYPYVELYSATGSPTMTLTSAASFTNVLVSAQSGITLDQGAKFLGGPNYQIQVGGTGQYLADVAGMTITAQVEFSSGGGTLGSDLAAVTTYSGQEIVGYSGTNMNLTSGAGGRVNFLGDIHNGNDDSIVKVGAGTVNLNDSEGRAEDQKAGWEVKNGTLLLNAAANSSNAISGSGLEIDNVLASALVANTQTYATLGGAGGTAIKVTADGANSSITPGDPTVNNGIGTLTLSGGLTAANGLTLNFNFSGATNSLLNLGSTAFTPGGVLTFNLNNVGSQDLLLNTPYDVIESGAGSSYSGSSFVFNAPDGYAATGSFDAATDVYSVEFTETPEPSTYALMLGGFAVLGFYIRRKGALLS